jgi:ketosteroid isomerase-like protein
MSETNLEVARRGYEAFSRGDFEWIATQMAPEIVWHDASEIPGARRRAGIEEVRAFLESFPRIWDEPRFEPEELHAAGDTVVALVRFSGRGRNSGAEVSRELAHLFELRSGRVERVVTYFDREQAMLALEEARAAAKIE